MSLAKTLAVAIAGVRAELVEIEADMSPGLPGMYFTGLADTSVTFSPSRKGSTLTSARPFDVREPSGSS